MPNAFFLEPDNLNGNSFSLDESESHHASHVFRLQPGDPIALLNGEGLGFQGVIENNSNGGNSNKINTTNNIESDIFMDDENKNGNNVAPPPGTPPATQQNTVTSNTPSKTYYPVENGRKLSSSLLWELQREFYEEQNVKAWSKSLVPHFVSSNAYLAHCYARLIIAYATDVYKKDPSFNYNDPPENTLKYFKLVRNNYLVLRYWKQHISKST